MNTDYVYKFCKKCNKETKRTNRGDDCRDCVNRRNYEYRRKHKKPERILHGYSKSRETGHKTKVYSSWMSIKQRCYYKNCTSFINYGAKGITMCDAWRSSFLNFLQDVGEPPEGDYVLSRKGDKGNYEPGNCEWKLRSKNSAERDPAKGEKVYAAKLTAHKIIEIRHLRLSGQTYKQISKIFGVHPSTIERIINGKTWKHIP